MALTPAPEGDDVASGTTAGGSLSGVPNTKDVRNEQGEAWVEIRRGLTPRWGRVIADAMVNLVALGAGLASWAYVDGAARWPWIVASGLWTGYWLHAHSLFLHEAAHYNLAPSRRANDLLASLMYTPLFGVTVATYRRIHWPHHRFLGMEGDTEISYCRPLNFRRLIGDLCGLGAIAAALRYASVSARGSTAQRQGRGGMRATLPIAGLFHSGLVLGLWLAWGVAAAASWLFGVLSYFMLQAVRQTLEHRAPSAGGRVLASPAEQGPVNRIFGEDFFSRTFGGAGFNKHMLHHWDPTVSYTRLGDMQRFLECTPLRDRVSQSTTTYLATARKLWHG